MLKNPKSGYDWSATGQWQTEFCVCQREHWECQRPCAQSRRQSKNAQSESWDLMWNLHSLTDWTQNNLSWSPAQLCQTTSRTAVVWNQSRCPSDSLQAANSCCKRYSLTSYGLGMKSVHCRTTIQLAEWSGLCTSWYQEATHRSQLLRTRLTFSRSVMVSVAVSQVGISELIFFDPRVKVKGQYYCDVLLYLLPCCHLHGCQM